MLQLLLLLSPLLLDHAHSAAVNPPQNSPEVGTCRIEAVLWILTSGKKLLFSARGLEVGCNIDDVLPIFPLIDNYYLADGKVKKFAENDIQFSL